MSSRLSAARDGEKVPIVVTASESMQALLVQADRAAQSDAKVLITGESGTGKDVMARRVHAFSARSTGPFVAVNCAGLTESLLESELFGHVKGSFTGAYRDSPGKLKMAHRGTLFLDEVGEMSLRMQALLLRFLENGEIQAVGSDSVRSTSSARVIAATNRDLGELVSAGQFREDLLYRLKVIHLHVPPLRERREDVAPLADHFLKAGGHAGLSFTEDALTEMRHYRWPGNVRELQNVVEQSVWLADRGVLDVAQLPGSIRDAVNAIRPSKERRRQVADDLYNALVSGGYSFWEHIYPLFLARDITRHDMRELVHRGLSVTRGSYRVLLRLFRVPSTDYKRFMNFLATHNCGFPVREFRQGTPPPPRRTRFKLPELDETPARGSANDGWSDPVPESLAGNDSASGRPARGVARFM